MPNKSGSWFRQKERILQKKKKTCSIIYCGLSVGKSAECFSCLPWLCWAVLLSSEQVSDGKTTTHILPFGQLWFRIHLWVSNTQFPHKALSNSGNTKKKGGILCQALARQGHCMYKPICQGTEPPHSSLILNKIHLQCSSDANVHCGRTNNRFVWAERFFLWFIQF